MTSLDEPSAPSLSSAVGCAWIGRVSRCNVARRLGPDLLAAANSEASRGRPFFLQ